MAQPHRQDFLKRIDGADDFGLANVSMRNEANDICARGRRQYAMAGELVAPLPRGCVEFCDVDHDDVGFDVAGAA